MKCDVVIKSFSRDYDRLILLLESISKYFHGYRTIHLFLDDEPDVSSLLRHAVSPLLDCNVTIVPAEQEHGYMLQQFYKLNGGEFSDADFLLPLDSDMVFFRRATPVDWLHEGKAFINYGVWRSPHHFPPPKLISDILCVIGRRTHDLAAYIAGIRANVQYLGVDILEDHGEKLVFLYEGCCYDIDSFRPHTTWLSSIKPIKKHPIDTMRIHYMFTRAGLRHVRDKITEYTGKNLRNSILDMEKFPIFSEYQVYGNIVHDCEGDYLGHSFISESDEMYSKLSRQLPIVKCNTRIASAYIAYRNIIDGQFAGISDRQTVLNDLRRSRAGCIGEEWH